MLIIRFPNPLVALETLLKIEENATLLNSLRGDIVGLVSISASIICAIELLFEYLEKLKSSSDGFALGSAYKGEQSVSIHEVKRELIKPIENMESELEVKHRLTGALATFSQLIKADHSNL